MHTVLYVLEGLPFQKCCVKTVYVAADLICPKGQNDSALTLPCVQLSRRAVQRELEKGEIENGFSGSPFLSHYKVD